MNYMFNCLNVLLAAIIRILLMVWIFSDKSHCCLRNVYLPKIICITEANARGHTYNPLKIRDFTTFSKY